MSLRPCSVVFGMSNVLHYRGMPLIVPIFKNGTRNGCNDHRGTSYQDLSLHTAASSVLGSPEPQAWCQGWIDSYSRHATHRSPKMVVFLGPTGVFGSVDLAVLCNAFHQKSMPEKIVNLLRALCMNTYGHVRVW